jgi:putative endonuclease
LLTCWQAFDSALEGPPSNGGSPQADRTANSHRDSDQRESDRTSQILAANGQTRSESTMNEYYVYILTNASRTLYTGMTNDLERRVLEHKSKSIPGFTRKYNISMLVWYDTFNDVNEAIEAEKRVKGWNRSKKMKLVEEANPKWLDLSAGW